MSVVDAWLSPMSTTVRERVRGRRPRPGRRARAAADNRTRAERRAAFRKLQLAAHWADLHPATADTGVETFGGAALAGRRVAGRRRDPGGGGVHPGTVRVGVGHVPVGRGTADRRRPRPAPPPPDALETRRSARGAGLAGPPGRPPDPPPLQGRRDLGRRTARRPRLPAARSSSTASSPKPSPAYDPEEHEDRENDAQAGWDVTLTHPDATDFLGTSHLEATGDTLTLKAFYDQVCAHRPPAVPRRRHRPARRPQDQGHRHPHRPTRATSGKSKVKVYARVDARDLEPDALAVGRDREARRRHPHQDPDLGRPPPSRHPTRPEHGPPRRRRLPRPTRMDARPRHPPRRPLHLPEMPGRRQVLRPRPHDPLRRERTTRPNHAGQPRRLCRRHHRAKTTGRWRYLRTPDGDYHWHGPYGTTYLVTARGTVALHRHA